MNATDGTPANQGLRSPVVALAAATLLLVLSVSAAAAQGTPTDAGSPPGDWVRATTPSTRAGLDLWDVAAGGPGFVAVGGGWADRSEVPTALIWVSDDGRLWQSVPLFGDAARGVIRSITATPEGFVAVGTHCCPDRAAVWLSGDGIVWERLPDQAGFEGAAMLGVAGTADGLVAIGCEAVMECGGGLAWASTDGRSWSEPATVSFLPFGIAWTATGWLALGSSEAYEAAAAAVSSSPDGVTWSEPLVLEVKGSLGAAFDTADGIVAAGGFFDFDSGTSGGVLLRSADGQAWEPISSRRLRQVWIEAVAARDDGFLLVGWRTTGDGQVPASLWTTDLATFTPVTFPRQVKAGGIPHGVAFAPDGSVAVAVGSTVLNRGQVPTAWVSSEGSPAER